jgi:hypothetical protein
MKEEAMEWRDRRSNMGRPLKIQLVIDDLQGNIAQPIQIKD